MFKKNWFYILLISLLSIGLTGCGEKGLPDDEVGKLFVDRLVYDKRSKEFKESFVDGDVLDKQMQVMTVSMQESFSTVFDAVADNLTDDEREKISQGLMERVRKTAQYEVESSAEGKDKIKVTYHIQGFDYPEFVGRMMTNMLKTGEEFEPNSQEAEQLVFLSYFEALEDTEESPDIVDVTINFERQKKQWLVSDNQDEDVDRLLLAFMSGTSSSDSYEIKVNDAVNQAVEEAKKRLK